MQRCAQGSAVMRSRGSDPKQAMRFVRVDYTVKICLQSVLTRERELCRIALPSWSIERNVSEVLEHA